MNRLLLAALALCPVLSHAALSPEAAAKNQPVAPFRIIGNLYYVGASDVTSFLISTPAGLILIDGGFAQTAIQIENNIATLGFRLSDVKIILNGHAHPDHAGGLAKLKRDSGARFDAMGEEVQPLEHHGQGTFYRGDRELFDSVNVDRVLHDGGVVKLGNVSLIAHLTAGHTPGCTTWTTSVKDGDRTYAVVFACQTTLPAGQALLKNTLYPDIAADFAHTFDVLSALPCDVFLAEHGSAFSLGEKIAAKDRPEAANPFIDPAGYRTYVSQSRQVFDAELAREKRHASIASP